MTVTIGGNDVAFADQLRECVYGVGGFSETKGCDARVDDMDAAIARWTSEKPWARDIKHAIEVTGIDPATYTSRATLLTGLSNPVVFALWSRTKPYTYPIRRG